MKNNKLPTPLTTGAIITRRNINLGLGHNAEVIITYDGPNEPTPEKGSEWPPEKDWPAAKIELKLPDASGTYQMHYDLHNEAIVALGSKLTADWQRWQNLTSGHSTGYVCRIQRRHGDSLRNLAAEMLREVMKELRPLQAHVAARAKRLAQREATTTKGIQGVREVAPAKTQLTN